jgi:hypothetical protein
MFKHAFELPALPTRYPTTLSSNFIGEVKQAHNRILDGEHPFSAWMGVLDLDYDDELIVRHLTGMSIEQCEKLSSDNHPDSMNVFPDAQTVKRFCDLTGVHPAHLEPGIRDPDCNYDPHVFSVILDLYLDNTAPQADRDVAYKALASEYLRYQAMMNDPAYDKYRSIINTADARVRYLRTREINVSLSPDLQDKFNLYDPYRFIDASTRLDCLMGQFTEAASNLTEQFKVQEGRLRTIYRKLLDDASLLYGEENEELALNKIFKAIEANRRLPNDKLMPLDLAFWADFGDDVFADLLYDLRGEIRTPNFHDARYNLPHFDMDCIERIEKEGHEFHEIKDSFMAGLEAYYNQQERLARGRHALRSMEDRVQLSALEHARAQDSVARRVVWPLWENVCQLRDRIPTMFQADQKQLGHSPV